MGAGWEGLAESGQMARRRQFRTQPCNSEVMWESEGKLTLPCRESGQSVSKDKEREGESQEVLLGGWEFVVGTRNGAEEWNHLCPSGGPSPSLRYWSELSHLGGGHMGHAAATPLSQN